MDRPNRAEIRLIAILRILGIFLFDTRSLVCTQYSESPRIRPTYMSRPQPSRHSLPAAALQHFLALVRGRGIKERSARWYVIRVEQFLRWLGGKSLTDCSANDLTQYLTELGRNGALKDWQFRQTVDALQIMMTKVLNVPDAADLDGAYWRASAQQLKPSHPTLAREIGPHELTPHPLPARPR
jgi:hypothetical protein